MNIHLIYVKMKLTCISELITLNLMYFIEHKIESTAGGSMYLLHSLQSRMASKGTG